MLSFPQIIVGDDILGGFRELIMADQSGRLEELAADATGSGQPARPSDAGARPAGAAGSARTT